MTAEPRIAVVFGTRPEIIKLGPVLEHLGNCAEVIYTGQHFDDNMSQVFFQEIGIKKPETELGIGGQSRASQIAQTAESLADRFEHDPPTAVVVQGDTNSTLGAALAANAANVPLVHVEAGLRSFDRNMPEEHNRVLTDHLSDLLCSPTQTSSANIANEAIDRPTYVTGNTVVDVALRLMPPPEAVQAVLARVELEQNDFFLSTFHRPENVDFPEVLATILDQLAALPSTVLLPLHPRTADRISSAGIEVSGNVRIVEPIGYLDFLALASACVCLVSDSGGVQEEASVLKKPVAVVRNSTERPEVIGTFAELITDRTAIADSVAALTDSSRLSIIATTPSPYGSGDAGKRTVEAMQAESLLAGGLHEG